VFNAATSNLPEKKEGRSNVRKLRPRKKLEKKKRCSCHLKTILSKKIWEAGSPRRGETGQIVEGRREVGGRIVTLISSPTSEKTERKKHLKALGDRERGRTYQR